MDKTMQTTLCHSIRACGFPKAVSLELQNTISKWDRCNGEQWTVDRLKAYKQWYESCLAGKPEPPAYFRKTRDGYPTGIFGKLFKTKNHAKVLAVLSVYTLYEAKSLTPQQAEKFTKALAGDQQQHRVDRRDDSTLFHHGIASNRKWHNGSRRTIHFPDVVPATPEDMTGSSIPIIGGNKIRLPHDPYERVHTASQAYIESWLAVPACVVDYLDRLDHLDWIPDDLVGIVEVPKDKHTNYPIGQIGLIQEPGLKLRSVANPNRIAQAFAKPLAYFWTEVLREIPTDYTFDQEAGARWVQEKLKAGQELSCSDLSSATDLLDLECCLQYARTFTSSWLRTDDDDQCERYRLAEDYFRNLSRGSWDTPKSSGLGQVRWCQGQPLGVYGSFALLALTNNCLGMLSALDMHKNPDDSHGCIGDDITMLSEIELAYNQRVEAIGGRINRSKTLRSSKVAEFAGMIIEPNRVMLKTIKFKQPSDQSFMSLVSDLGPQARSLLANRQRKMWDEFKYIPGIAYPGPWSKDSFGEPLTTRVAWTESTSLVDEVPSRDKETVSLEQALLRATLEKAQTANCTVQDVYRTIPWPVDEDLQSSRISGEGKPSGDPRRVDGKTTLQRLEESFHAPSFKRYKQFKEEESSKNMLPQSALPLITSLNLKPAIPRTPVLGEDKVDGDEPDDQTAATGGVQQTEEPSKGPSESTEGSKPPVVGPVRSAKMQQVFDLAARQETERLAHLEDENPSNPSK